jgi:exodeoxyribonuclease VII large subunit
VTFFESDPASSALPGEASSPAAPQALTVSEFTARVRAAVEPKFAQVWIRGEVSGAKVYPASGHLYFSLKDSNAVISATFFGWSRRPQKFELKDGMEVICFGKFQLYPARSTYQIQVSWIQPAGVGALQAAFERMKAKLQAEGLFDPARKRKLPVFPRKVAIVTSPSGAAIQDMLNVFKRRAPGVEILVVAAAVQGADAPAQLIRALERAQKVVGVDVVVLARGGGSLEDLWAFNDEGLARAISACSLPVVSAVGHEVDFSISDFVADVRAATPSVGAEILSQGWSELGTRVGELKVRLVRAMMQGVRLRRERLQTLRARLVSPRDRLRLQSQRLDETGMRLQQAMQRLIEMRRHRLERLSVAVDALSPLRVLNRGYALVSDAGDGTLVKHAAGLQLGRGLTIRFQDGQARVQVVSDTP